MIKVIVLILVAIIILAYFMNVFSNEKYENVIYTSGSYFNEVTPSSKSQFTLPIYPLQPPMAKLSRP